MIPRMSKTSRAKLLMDTTTAISTVQSGGLGSITGGVINRKKNRHKSQRHITLNLLKHTVSKLHRLFYFQTFGSKDHHYYSSNRGANEKGK